MTQSIFTTSKQALLVIDVQASFTQRPYYSTDGLNEFLAAQNALIAQATARGVPIVRVFHQSATNEPSDPFSRSSSWVRPFDGLAAFEAAHTVYKTRHSALVGTGLDVWLTQNCINEVIVSGIRTEQCCETTARHASDLGWNVCFVPEATWTWAIPITRSTTLGVAHIRERTQAVLEGRFARFATLGV